MGALLAVGGPAVELPHWEAPLQGTPSSVRESWCRNHGYNIQDFAVAVAPSKLNSENMSSTAF